LLNCIDISNWTGLPTADQFKAWKDAGIELVIVQAIAPPPGFPAEVDRQQAQGVLDAGMKLSAYTFHWTGTTIARDNAARFAGYGFPVERWWGDFEDVSPATPAQRETEIAELLAYLDTLSGKRPAGAYTGAWWTKNYLAADSQVFAGRALWLAQYDGIDLLNSVAAVCGGTVSIHQYGGTSTLGGVPNVDLNVAADSEFGDFPGVPADPIPPDDPCAAITAAHDALVVTVADIADRLGDALLADCTRSSVRKSVIRGIVAQMARERAQAIGPRPS